MKDSFIPELSIAIQSVLSHDVSEARKTELAPLIKTVSEGNKNCLPVRLNFICTHNSRRSHFAQIWAQIAAAYFDIDNVHCYSGGTESTALNSTVIMTLMDAGIEVEQLSIGDNPIYAIKYDYNEQPVLGFSKTYDHPFNPRTKFTAIMVCDNAKEHCPIVHGAEDRIAINYDDPKAFDNSPDKMMQYKLTNITIAAEMLYVFSQVKLA